MTRPLMSLCALLAAASAACTGTDVGNPVVDVDFALLQTQSPVTVDRAWLAVDRIRLRSSAACDGDAEREFEGPFAVDLLAPGPVEQLAGLDMPSGNYCRFEVKWNAFSSGLPPGTPPELDESSIAITGTRGDGTSFVLRSARDDELRLDAVEGAFTIDEATNALFVGLNTARLFTGVDLDAAVIDPDGTIYIDGENNEPLLRVFDDNLRDAASLFDDDNGNGELDADESEPAEALAN
jgi:hypothetical protein